MVSDSYIKGLSKRRNFVYGPWLSRRLGYSLGIDANPYKDKTCTFDCVYCEFGKTVNKFSSLDEIRILNNEKAILDDLESRLCGLKNQNWDLNSLTFSGRGEPTLFPGLKELAIGVKKLRNTYFPGVPVNILTNSSLLCFDTVFEALKEFDFVLAKLDVGSNMTFREINRPSINISDLDRIIEDLSDFQKATEKVVLQTLIFKSSDSGKLDNSSRQEMERIIDRMLLINPLRIQVYTVSRPTFEHYVAPADYNTMQKITQSINEKMGKRCAEVYN